MFHVFNQLLKDDIKVFSLLPCDIGPFSRTLKLNSLFSLSFSISFLFVFSSTARRELHLIVFSLLYWHDLF